MIRPGLGEEPPSSAMAAGLAMLAAVAYLFSLGQRSLVSSPLLTGVTAIVVASLAVSRSGTSTTTCASPDRGWPGSPTLRAAAPPAWRRAPRRR